MAQIAQGWLAPGDRLDAIEEHRGRGIGAIEQNKGVSKRGCRLTDAIAPADNRGNGRAIEGS